MNNRAVSGCLLLSSQKIGTITCKHGDNGCGARQDAQGDAGLQQGPAAVVTGVQGAELLSTGMTTQLRQIT